MKYFVFLWAVVINSLLLVSCSSKEKKELTELEKIIYDIRTNPKWLENVEQQAEKRGLTLDSMLIRVANYRIRMRAERKERLKKREFIINEIKSNPEELERMKQDAQERHISLDSMLLRSANDKIKIEEDRKALKKEQAVIIKEIRSTPKWIKKIQSQAKERGISVDSMLIRNANYIINKRKEK